MIPQRVFMVGIGGIGMSALAQYLIKTGHDVSGSDRDVSPTTELLEQVGVTVHIGHTGAHVPADTEMLIYSDAVWPDNPERILCAEMNITQISYFEALGIVSAKMRTVAVAGTHGKTTTTGMLARMLSDGGANPTAIIGSIVRDFKSNFLHGTSDIFVVEACEYRDHVLELSPEVLVLTNVEWDHTDFFPSLEALQATFRKSFARVPAHGAIVTNPTHPAIAPLLVGVSAEVIDYTKVTIPELTQIGEFNKDNARAAKAAAHRIAPEIPDEKLDSALADFKGAWRRFEYKGITNEGATVYDDYAHHPTAIQKTIEAARNMYPSKKITVVFHPHLYSRTHDLFSGFVNSLALADAVILVPIYPAREVDTGIVSSDMIRDAIAKINPQVISAKTFDEVVHTLHGADDNNLIITMGAGDVYKVAEMIVTTEGVKK